MQRARLPHGHARPQAPSRRPQEGPQGAQKAYDFKDSAPRRPHEAPRLLNGSPDVPRGAQEPPRSIHEVPPRRPTRPLRTSTSSPKKAFIILGGGTPPPRNRILPNRDFRKRDPSRGSQPPSAKISALRPKRKVRGHARLLGPPERLSRGSYEGPRGSQEPSRVPRRSPREMNISDFLWFS